MQNGENKHGRLFSLIAVLVILIGLVLLGWFALNLGNETGLGHGMFY